MKKFTKIVSICLMVFSLSITISNILYASSNKDNVGKKSKSSQKDLKNEQVNEEGTDVNGNMDNNSNEQSQNDTKLNNFLAPFKEKKEVDQEGEIKGKVLDSESRPVYGVVVKCFNESGVLVQESKTNTKGEYFFKDLPKGKYKIVVEYQPTAKQIDLKGKKGIKRAPIPTGLNVTEMDYNIYGKSFIRATWDKMPNVDEYKCEILDRATKNKIVEIDGIKQNYCEFGNLNENTEYMVKVYSKNEIGLSLSYALAFIKTIDKKPPAPYNLSYTYAKNNRIDLEWNGIDVADLKGYVLQVRKEKGPYLYYSTNGLVRSLKDAYIIPAMGELIRLQLSGYDSRSNPVIENSIPYSFRVFEIDESNNLSSPSGELSDIVLKDTVPPLPITDIEYKNLDNNIIRISWKTTDKDVVKYKLYYGINKNHWDGVITTSKNYYDFAINRQYLPEGKIFVAVTAVDRAGNESGYKPVSQDATIDGKVIVQKIVLSEMNVYKDFSIAIKALKPIVNIKRNTEKKEKKVVKKTVPKPKKYGYYYLKKKGFVVENGELATLAGKINVPKNIMIKVKSGGRLILKNLSIAPANDKDIWGGIRFLEGSSGEINNVTIRSAVRGIVILSNKNIRDINNLKVYDSKEEGLFISNSKINLINSTLKNNEMALYIDNSSVRVENVLVSKNNKGILFSGYKLYLKNSNILDNRSYGIRISGTTNVSDCTIKNNQVGIFIEKGIGKAKIENSVIDNNKVDGIVVESSNVDIINNEISSNRRFGIYVRKEANPFIIENNISNNNGYGVFGGGKVIKCYVAFNNGSPYIDETKIKGKIDGIFSSSSSDIIKQIYNVDYIEELSLSPIVFSKNK